MKNNEIDELLKKEVYIQFAFACLNKDTAKVREYLEKKYIDDLSYGEGMFAIYAARSGGVEILEILYKECSEIKKYQYDIFQTAARYGQKDCVEFLLKEQEADPKELQGTTAYDNYPEIEKLFNEWGVNNHLEIIGKNEELIVQ